MGDVDMVDARRGVRSMGNGQQIEPKGASAK